MRRKKYLFLIIIALAVVLLVCIVLSTAFGAVRISVSDITEMVLNKTRLFHFEQVWPASNETIVFNIRMPRIIGGVLVGAALACAGTIFQGLLRNPLADPYIIGTSAGAALGVTVAMLLPMSITFLQLGLIPLAAFCGAMATVLLVYNLARVGGKTPVVNMLLAGFVISSLLTAVMTLLMAVNDRLQHQLGQVFRFLWGGVSVGNWGQLAVVAVLIIGCIIVSIIMARHLNVFSIGEEGASHLGLSIEKEKIVFLGLGSLLTAVAVSIGGLIGFVGLITPHIVRLIFGPDHRILLPVAALLGGIFVVLADLFARTLTAPGEIPVGAITAIIGGPFFIYLLRRSRKEYAF
ncbi:MAG: iron ABC transporter permease [Chloroflexi bacterium]|nr:iron ABC transporter permease [Chloroflexota bacterium]